MQCHTTHSSKNMHVPTQMSTCHGCPMSRVLTHAYAKCEKPNRHFVPSMTIFQNKRFLFYKSNPLDGSRYQLAFPKFRVFMNLWVMDFQVHTSGHHTPFQHFYGLSPSVIMSNCECRVFHPKGGGGGGGSTPTCYA